MPRRRLAALLAAVTALLPRAVPAPAADGGPPADYTKTAGLTQPQYETRKETVYLPAFDGEPLYLEITRPRAAGRFPVILESSPYHGTLADRDGTRILPGPKNADGKPIGLTGYFSPRGYVVVMMDLRGTGRSQGCLDHLGGKDARDLKQVVEWAASQSWSNGRVGMTGHSYVGSTPPVAAAQNPRGLATIVPSAGLASMYDHQFQDGVPYWLQWVGPMEAYEQLALERKLPPFSDPTGTTHPATTSEQRWRTPAAACRSPSLIAGEDQLSGRYSAWHEQRDWRAGATAARIPVFAVHGVNDNAARVAALDWFLAAPPRRRQALARAVGPRLGLLPEPPRRPVDGRAARVVRQAARAARRQHRPARGAVHERRHVRERPRRRPRRDRHRHPLAGRDAAAHVLPERRGRARGLARDAGRQRRRSRATRSGFTDPKNVDAAEFATPALASDLVLAGVPKLTLVRLGDRAARAPDLDALRLRPRGRAAPDRPVRDQPGAARRDRQPPARRARPALRDAAVGLRDGAPPARRPPAGDAGDDRRPGQGADVRRPTRRSRCSPGRWRRSSTCPSSAARCCTRTTCRSTSRRPAAAIRPARRRRRVAGSATPVAPGAGARQEGVDSAFFEFDAQDGFDNARMVVEAGYDATGDVDLYLQRRRADGTWSDDLASRRVERARRRAAGVRPARARAATGSRSSTSRRRRARGSTSR